MTQATYNRGKSPWTIACDPQCESDGKSTARRKAIRTAFYKVHASGSFSFNDESTWPPVQTMVCHRCGKDHSGQAIAEPTPLTAAPSHGAYVVAKGGQAFDAMGDAWDNINMETGKFPSGFSTQLAKRIRKAIGCDWEGARARSKKVCSRVKFEWKQESFPRQAFAEMAETKEDTAAQTLKFIQHISPPQSKPVPKVQTKPVPQADGSIEVMSVELFVELSKHTPIKMMEVTTVIEVETITVNGLVFRCS